MKVRIESDLFDITGRLRQIDPSYFVVYDLAKERFEVHSSAQRGNTLCVVVPYKSLDVRTVHKVRQTRIERRKKLFEMLEQEELEYERTNNQKLRELSLERIDMIKHDLFGAALF